MSLKINLLICFFILHLWAATGHKIGIYEIKKGDFSVKVTSYGARIISVLLPDKNGKIGDIVLGYDTIGEYVNDTSSFGAIVGRVVNRIAGARFTLNGTLYKLIANDGKNTIHGGPKGFSHVVWKVSKYKKDGPHPHITLTYHSTDGEQGFPGDLLASVTYALEDPNKLSVVMKAKALNKATPVNLAQHTYWNLGGHNSGDVLSNDIQIFASHITPLDQHFIPTGKIAPVKNTPYDFLKPRKIGSQFKKLQNGYDINYPLDSTEKLKPTATVHDNKSGRVMSLQTTAPAVQLYTANTLVKKGKGGFVYQPYSAVCLETQGFPDAVNHPNFPSTILINKCKDIGGVHKLKAERACHRHSKVSKLLELTMPSKINLLICLFILHLWAAVSVTEQKIGVYEIKKGDFSVKITNYGARIISVFLPDKHGVIGDVVLGYDTTEEYKNDTTSFGALLGRVANRIGGAQFTLNGTLYKLVANDGTNTLHGGINGFSRVVWNVSKYQQDGPYPHITLTYHSVDGEEGFPGDLLVSVTYALKDPYKLSVVMKAEALNKATPVNLAQHSYWNLGGHNSGDILSNVVQIFASHITPVDQSLIPTGKISPIKNTPYDFLKPREVGSQIKELQSGYDINYVLDSTEKMKPVAIVYDEKSGRVMDVQASAPGVQFYTANSLNQKGKGGYVYQPHAALCFETQGFPDAVNHPNFPSTIVTPGKAYIHKMLYTFSIMKYLNSY